MNSRSILRAAGALALAGSLLVAQKPPKQPQPKSQKEVEAINAIFNPTDPDARIAAVKAGLPYVAVLPYEGVASVWSDTSRAWFEDLRDGALLTITIDSRAPDTKQQAGLWLRRRDQWIAERVAEAIVVAEPDDDTYRSLVTRLGDENVFLLRP